MQSESTYKDRCGDAFVYIAFAAYAAVLGGFLSRLPDIQLALKASNYEFGLILLGVPTGIIIGSVFFSAFIERIGAKKSSAVFTIIFSICPILSGAASSGVALAASLALQGLMLSLANVSINVLAHQMEKAQDRRLLNKCHGVWSITLLAA